MCYMGVRGARVGVRELRQNLSVYLRRVVKGESFEVTDRGRVVALLAPLPESSSPVQRLVAAGRASNPQGGISEVIPPRGKPSRRLSDALEEQRAERL
jgi:prevent-host-death family protein